MSALSSITAALAGSGLFGKKSEAQAEESGFLSLLDLGQEQQGALVGTLYQDKDAPLPVAAAVEPQAPLAERTPVVEAGQDNAVEEVSSALAAQDAPKAHEPQDVDQEMPVASDKAQPAKEPSPPAANESASAATQKNIEAVVNTSGHELGGDTLAAKLRSKIEELSSILSAIASLFGVGQQAVQVTQVSVAQFSLTSGISTAQAELGVNQPFVDLSDRFQQLINAISASQNLAPDTATPLTMTFRSFQALFVSFAAVQDNNSPMLTNAFLASCQSCDTQIGMALQTLNISQTAGKGDIAQTLAAELGKLQQWLGSFESLVQPALAVDAPTKFDAVVASVPQIITAPAVTNSVVTNSVAVAAKPVNDNVPAAPLIAANASGVDSVSPLVAGSPVAVAAVVENNAGASAQFSGGNTGQHSGGNAPSSTPVTATASSAISQTQTAFAKALSAASTHTPVVEQVAFHIKTVAKTGDSKIDITLDPAELGKLQVKMSIDGDGKAIVSITADHKSTLDLLQRDARGLEQALADAGIKAESGSLSFNLRGGDQQQSESKPTYAGYVPVQEEDELAPLTVVSRSYVVNLEEGVDINV